MFAKQSIAIGINHHDLERLDLKPCINDAKDLTNALKSIGFRALAGSDLSMNSCRSMIDQFISSIRPGAVCVFYFSGHGVQWQGNNYLISSDARGISADNIQERTIDAQDVIRRMHEKRPRLVICILDCCRTDAPTEAIDSQAMYYGKLPRSGEGLAPMRAPPATLIAFACAAGETASAASQRNRNSLYTSHLLRYIRMPNVDIEHLLKLVAIEVQRESGNDQVPFRYSSCNEFIYLANGIVKKQISIPRPLPLHMTPHSKSHHRHHHLHHPGYAYGYQPMMIPNMMGFDQQMIPRHHRSVYPMKNFIPKQYAVHSRRFYP